MPKEILDSILIMNDYVVQIKEVYDILEENIPIFFYGGLIKWREYTEIKKQISDIHELVVKFENIDWNPFCHVNILDDAEDNESEIFE